MLVVLHLLKLIKSINCRSIKDFFILKRFTSFIIYMINKLYACRKFIQYLVMNNLFNDKHLVDLSGYKRLTIGYILRDAINKIIMHS